MSWEQIVAMALAAGLSIAFVGVALRSAYDAGFEQGYTAAKRRSK